MEITLDFFERVARNTVDFCEKQTSSLDLHPFDLRNIHSGLPIKVRKLFDDGHCAEATFEAFKYLDKTVQKLVKSDESGYKLMMKAFNEATPLLRLNNLSTASEKDEQKGYSFIFSGAMMAIRNPRGHESNSSDDPDVCLDHLALASLLIRRLEQSKLL